MPTQPARLFAISAIRTSLYVGSRQDLYLLHVPRTVFVNLMVTFEATRCLQYHRDLPLCIYFDTEGNCEIVQPDYDHRCDERFDEEGEIMENELHFHDWSFPPILSRDLYAYLMSRVTIDRYFFREDFVHIVTEYVTRYSALGPTLRLCLECYHIDDTSEAVGYAHRKKHGVFARSDLILILRQRSLWCFNCVRTPLFRLLTLQACRSYTNLHRGGVSDIFWTVCRGSQLFDYRIRTQERVNLNVFPEQFATDSD
ncbi:hypothetical protein AVEN_114596-1 [Araneus ventricosus]|uniref:Uncharacterized protein n=1 Tax=Araneus ventricosus TaxID=182803 RepID=A0A4Y2GAV1_ARAVE|nr:hypothetical protein AVEN_114596-1 [Araneus ventricosus]